MDDHSVGLREALFKAPTSSLCDLVDGFLSDDVALPGNGGGCDRLVASHHDHLHAGRTTLEDCVWDGVTWRVGKGKNAHEAEPLQQVVLVNVKVVVLGVFSLGQVALGETQHSLSVFAESGVGIKELLVPLLCLGDGLSSLVDEGASFPDTFRCALHEDAVMGVFRFVVVD
jgi:hypothetical protein